MDDNIIKSLDTNKITILLTNDNYDNDYYINKLHKINKKTFLIQNLISKDLINNNIDGLIILRFENINKLDFEIVFLLYLLKISKNNIFIINNNKINENLFKSYFKNIKIFDKLNNNNTKIINLNKHNYINKSIEIINKNLNKKILYLYCDTSDISNIENKIKNKKVVFLKKLNKKYYDIIIDTGYYYQFHYNFYNDHKVCSKELISELTALSRINKCSEYYIFYNNKILKKYDDPLILKNDITMNILKLLVVYKNKEKIKKILSKFIVHPLEISILYSFYKLFQYNLITIDNQLTPLGKKISKNNNNLEKSMVIYASQYFACVNEINDILNNTKFIYINKESDHLSKLNKKYNEDLNNKILACLYFGYRSNILYNNGKFISKLIYINKINTNIDINTKNKYFYTGIIKNIYGVKINNLSILNDEIKKNFYHLINLL